MSNNKVINIDKIVRENKKIDDRKALENIQKENIDRISKGIEGYKKRIINYCKQDIDFLNSKGIDIYNETINNENKNEDDYFSDLED